MGPSKVREFLSSCPGCKTFETIWIMGNTMIPTKRFKQKGKYIYHDCTLTDKPCRLFPRLKEEQ